MVQKSNMIRAVVENLVGVVVGEAMAGQGGRHMSRDQQGYQQQQQQHEPQRPIASLVDSVTDVGNRLLRAAVKVSASSWDGMNTAR